MIRFNQVLAGFFIFFLFQSGQLNAEHSPLRDKIGQMLVLGFEGKEVHAGSPIIKEIRENNIGGVVLFDYNFHTKSFNKNIQNPDQLRKLNHDLQNAALKANHYYKRASLPLLIAIDYEGGAVNRLKKSYGFPEIGSPKNVAQEGPTKARETSAKMALVLKDMEINLNFAPVLDVNLNSENPVIGSRQRSFSEDPAMVVTYGKIYTEAFLNNGIQCAYKHFPGHGSSMEDSHLGFVDVTKTWQKLELIPFKRLINNPISCGMVMVGHIINRNLDSSGLPATLSFNILTKLLRDQMKFQGVIITDDLQMKAITDHFGLEQTLVLAINAGADMLLFNNQLNDKPISSQQLIDLIKENVKKGKIPSSRINESYQRIIKFKKEISLSNNQFQKNEDL